MNYRLICVVAEYDKNENAVREKRVKLLSVINPMKSWDIAEMWLNSMTKKKIPAYFYLDGMQNCDAFPFLLCPENKYYHSEYRKVIDL